MPGTPLVKVSSADMDFSTNIMYDKASFKESQAIHELAF
jgi:hypothetical protein